MNDDTSVIKVLDHGFVRLVDHMGNDQRIVDAARVSYGQGTKTVSSNRGLIRYLLKNLHTTPFEKVRFEFHVKLPIFVARQWMRHRTGSFNETSGRYSELPDEFYVPDPLRKQSTSNKQGSSHEKIEGIPVPVTDPDSGVLIALADPQNFIRDAMDDSYAVYQQLLEAGAAKELARGVLPVNIYTEFYWTVDLWNLMHFLRLRLDAHSQWETRQYGQAVFDLVVDKCDLSIAMEAFCDYILDKPDLSKFEMQIIKEMLYELQASSILPVSIQEILIDKLAVNSNMGEREKKESKLIKLLLEP